MKTALTGKYDELRGEIVLYKGVRHDHLSVRLHVHPEIYGHTR